MIPEFEQDRRFSATASEGEKQSVTRRRLAPRRSPAPLPPPLITPCARVDRYMPPWSPRLGRIFRKVGNNLGSILNQIIDRPPNLNCDARTLNLSPTVMNKNILLVLTLTPVFSASVLKAAASENAANREAQSTPAAPIGSGATPPPLSNTPSSSAEADSSQGQLDAMKDFSAASNPALELLKIRVEEAEIRLAMAAGTLKRQNELLQRKQISNEEKEKADFDVQLAKTALRAAQVEWRAAEQGFSMAKALPDLAAPPSKSSSPPHTGPSVPVAPEVLQNIDAARCIAEADMSAALRQYKKVVSLEDEVEVELALAGADVKEPEGKADERLSGRLKVLRALAERLREKALNLDRELRKGASGNDSDKVVEKSMALQSPPADCTPWSEN